MDNLSSYKGGSRNDRKVGAKLEYLPPYSRDFNPIENAFPKLNALLRKAAERTIESLWTTIGRISNSSPRTNAATISQPQAMMQRDRIPL